MESSSQHKMLYKVKPETCDQSFSMNAAEFAKPTESDLPCDPKESWGAERARQLVKDFLELPLDKYKGGWQGVTKTDLDRTTQQLRELTEGIEKDATKCSWLRQRLVSKRGPNFQHLDTSYE
ncbi:hypothetical protein C2S51_029545 [Perilla frutescens var. frutescens]|nr:hypothetical protein C2S51_029545 [Perilla frutescens var. frutescens]